MTADEIMKKLQDPFPPDDVEWRVGSTNKEKTSGLALAYITNRAIQNRLDEVFGPFGWQNQFKEWKQNSQICGISVFWNGQWITKWDGADDSQTEAIKGGLSDSMKRAAYQWGIGRYLYKLEQQWCKLKQAGNSYVLAEEPKLPGWALPEGYTPPKTVKAVTNINTSSTTQKSATGQNNNKSEDVKFECSECKVTISDAVHDWSIKNLIKKPLCSKCQQKYKQCAAK